MTLRSAFARAAALAVALAAVAPLAAAEAPTLAAAKAAFEAKRWDEAARGFQAAVEADPDNAEAWYQLGVSRRELKQYDRALAAVEKAREKGHPASFTVPTLAIIHALAGDLDRAFARLEEAVQVGVPMSVLETHPGLAAARADARFAPFLAAAEQRAHPCEHDPRYRAFDFWVGEWDLYSGSRKLGENRIAKDLRGCLITESWTDAAGSSGKSMNYFDATSGKWRQNWVSDNGTLVWYEGEVKDGAMHFQGENRTPTGTVSRERVTLTPQPDGSIRHQIEQSEDGKTWATVFNALYVKKGQAPPA